MLSQGKPGYLPWTTDDCSEATAQFCKPLFGNARQRCGTTFAKAIAACPNCCFAAYDVDTGFVLATGDYTIRDEALRRIRADDTKAIYFYTPRVNTNPRTPYWVTTYAVNKGTSLQGKNWAQTYWNGGYTGWWGFGDQLNCYGNPPDSILATFSYWEEMSLPERVTAWLQRVVGGGWECGHILWFGGSGQMTMPAPEWPLRTLAHPLPLLAIYGVFAPDNPYDIRPAMRDFGGWLRTALARPSTPLVAAAADKEHFVRKTRRGKVPVAVWPTPAFPITVGQTLEAVLLTGGAALVSGHFEFMVKLTRPPAGVATHRAMFVPSNLTAYMPTYGRIEVTVNRKSPQVIISPLASPVYWGDTLATSVLGSSSMSVPGNWAWLNPAITPPLGISQQTAVFTPNDTTNYQPITYSVAVSTVLAVIEVATWPTAGNLTAGQALSESALSGGVAPVPGVFAWDVPGTVPPVGVTEHLVRFTPTQTARYATPFPTANVSVTVV